MKVYLKQFLSSANLHEENHVTVYKRKKAGSPHKIFSRSASPTDVYSILKRNTLLRKKANTSAQDLKNVREKSFSILKVAVRKKERKSKEKGVTKYAT